MGLFSWGEKEKPATEAAGIDVKQAAPGRMVMTARGILTAPMVADAQRSVLAIGAKSGRLRGLIDARQFRGFARGFDGGMEEIERKDAIDSMVDRLAVVADPQNHDNLKLFLLAGMRNSAIKFFAPDQMRQAQAWLES